MKHLQLKVCGMTQSAQLNALIDLKVDYAGLIFYKKSARYVVPHLSPNAVKSFSGIQKIGVFVNAEKEEILNCVTQYGLNGVQLHGDESPKLCADLQEKGLIVFKAFRLQTAKDLIATTDYQEVCTRLLFDTAGKHYGGNGKSFNWQILENYRGTTPFILSGGIGPDSLIDLQKFTHPAWAGLDLNSKFETAPGDKNINLLKRFLCQLTIN